MTKVEYLLKKVFGDLMDLSNVDEVIDHCKTVFVENVNFLYKEGSNFSHPKFDLCLKEAAENVVFSI